MLNTTILAEPTISSWRKITTLEPVTNINEKSHVFSTGFLPSITEPIEFAPVDVFTCLNIFLLANERINILLDKEEQPVRVSDLNLSYMIDIFNDQLRQNQATSLLESDVKLKVLDRCVLLAGWGPHSWGHFIVEFLPRLFILREYFNQFGTLPIYISEITPSYIIKAITFILSDFSPVLAFFPDKGKTFFKEAVIPPFINFGGKLGYHPFFSSAFSKWLAKLTLDVDASSSPSLLYVSRKHENHKSITYPRTLVNEDDLIIELSRIGAAIVAMEEIEFEDKIKILSTAKCIIGGWGSGLLNSLLSISLPQVISVGLGFNSSQIHVCDAMRQPYYEVPTYDPVDQGRIITNIRGVSQFVKIDKLVEGLNYLQIL